MLKWRSRIQVPDHCFIQSWEYRLICLGKSELQILEQDPANISLRNLDSKFFAVLEKALVDKYLCVVYYLSFLVKKKKKKVIADVMMFGLLFMENKPCTSLLIFVLQRQKAEGVGHMSIMATSFKLCSWVCTYAKNSCSLILKKYYSIRKAIAANFQTWNSLMLVSVS